MFRIGPEGNPSVFLRDDLLQGTLHIPEFLDDVGMAAVEYAEGDPSVIAMADGSLVRVPVQHSGDAQKVKLSARKRSADGNRDGHRHRHRAGHR
ncbi:hypothetical protein ACFUTR_05395 [Streptomyces sp. NPDC057367]|uniref:hypothetical protein n=1 Tax=Streptomyces sp. NPDC057367 TaxID=3346108 RepID=UPI00363DF431